MKKEKKVESKELQAETNETRKIEKRELMLSKFFIRSFYVPISFSVFFRRHVFYLSRRFTLILSLSLTLTITQLFFNTSTG